MKMPTRNCWTGKDQREGITTREKSTGEDKHARKGELIHGGREQSPFRKAQRWGQPDDRWEIKILRNHWKNKRGEQGRVLGQGLQERG